MTMTKSGVRLLLVAIAVQLSSFSVKAQVYGKPHGTVQSLTKANFKSSLDDPANGFWFLKFYAPWCSHCKALAPVLDKVAPQLKGDMAIGKIDCTVETELCNDFDIRGYPTLKFSRDGEIMDYPANRKEEDILRFAKRMSLAPVSSCHSYQDAIDLARNNQPGVAFVVHHPQALLEDDDDMDKRLQSQLLTQIFRQVARTEQAFAQFCFYESTDLQPFQDNRNDKDIDLSNGFVAQVDPMTKPILWEQPSEISSVQLKEFVKQNKLPLISQFGPSNFAKIGRKGRHLVIGCIDGENPTQIEDMKQHLAEYATSGPKSIVESYYFGWMDAQRWHRFLSQFDISADKLPQILVLDVPTKLYWQNETYTQVKDVLNAIDAGTYKAKKPAGQRGFMGFLRGIQNLFFHYLPWSLVAVFAVMAVLFLIIIPPPDDMPPDYQHAETDDDGMPIAKATSKEKGPETTPATKESKKDK